MLELDSKPTHKTFQDLTGKTIGLWSVLEYIGFDRNRRHKKRHYWLCRCSCGELGVVSHANLKTENTKSCGCLRRRHASMYSLRNSTHGKSGTKVYVAWLAMRRRCYQPNDTGYKNYGARGIEVCEQWLQSFKAFYADMGDPPTAQHSLDRKDPDGNYEPDNCQWATPQQQGGNRRSVRLIEYEGQKQSIATWAKQYGLRPTTLWSRLKRGWRFDRAINEKSWLMDLPKASMSMTVQDALNQVWQSAKEHKDLDLKAAYEVLVTHVKSIQTISEESGA